MATLKDYSGNNNHGTQNGGIVSTVDRFGNLNSAYSFDGVDDFIQVKNSPTLNPTKITISAWYFATKSFSGNGNNVIVHKPYTSHTLPAYQWHLGVGGDLYNNSGKFSFDGWVAAPTAFATGGKKIATAEVVGKWHHVATSFDGTIIRVYVDGKLETVSANFPSSSPISSYNTDVFIGKHGNLNRSQIDYTPAVMDDILIYNRALSEAEIKQLYNAPNPKGECANPATYDAETGLVTLPAIDIPLLLPISGESTGEVAVFSGKLKQVQGVNDFEIVANSLTFINTISQYDQTHARYEYNDGIFANGGKLKACVSIPSIAIIPPNTRIITGSKNYKVSLRHLAVSPSILHLESAELAN